MITEVANTEKLNPIKVKEEGHVPSSPPSSNHVSNQTAQIRDQNQQPKVQQKAEEIKDQVQEQQTKKSVLEKQINTLTNKMYKLNRELVFKVDKRINRNYISIIDKKTKEVIKEVPPREIRSFMARLQQIHESGKTDGNVRNLMLNLEA